MSRVFQRVPQFWLLQIFGWLAYVSTRSFDLFTPFEGRRVAAITHGIFYGSLFLASLVLRFIYNRVFFRNRTSPNTSWFRILLQTGIFSVVMAVPCGVVTEWAWMVLGEPRVTAWNFAKVAGQNTLYGILPLVSWSVLYLGIKHYRVFQAARERAVQAESLAREARLRALRYQLNPHFLFNTLNAISTLVAKGDSVAANQMLVRLAGFLRSTLYGLGAQEIPLRHEKANTERYLEIEKARLGERLELDFSITPDVQDAVVPVLFLQPLVENAIRHGIAPNPQGGKLTIQAMRNRRRVRITVSNDGTGPPALQGKDGMQRRGLGLSNTLERLRVLYGEDHRLVVHYPSEGGCRVEIEFPYRTENSEVPVVHGEELCAS